MEDLTITIRIAERNYKLAIPRNEEELVRNSSNIIEKRIVEYSKNYAFKDMQDLLSMVALHFTIETLKLEQKQEYINEEILPKLDEINKMLLID